VLFLSSLVLVFGTVAVFAANVILGDSGRLAVGYRQMVHAEVPYLLIGALALGVMLGIAAVVRRRSLSRIVVVGLEAVVLSFFLYLVFDMTVLPAHELAVSVGDSFPAYALPDQDEVVHTTTVGEARAPGLYIFYRGDW